MQFSNDPEHIRQQKKLGKIFISRAATVKENLEIQLMILHQGMKPLLHDGEWRAAIQFPNGAVDTAPKEVLNQVARMIVDGVFYVPSVDVLHERKRRANYLLRVAPYRREHLAIRTALKQDGLLPKYLNGEWTGHAVDMFEKKVSLSAEQEIQMAKLIYERFYGNEYV